MRLEGFAKVMVLAWGVLLLCGCPNPNLYTTPRTLDPGTLQWQVAAEGFGASFNQPPVTNADGTTSPGTTGKVVTPTFPTFGIRYGVAEGVEIGARVANLDTLAGDAKIRLLKGTLDLAVDPGLQFIYLGSVSSTDGNGNTTSAAANIFYFHLPLLVGLNLSKEISLVASPGIVYALTSESLSSSTNSTQAAIGASGALARLGFGVNIRVNKRFSLQPEITFMKAFSNNDALLYVFGLGFNIGAHPDYSDIGAPAPPEAPPPAPPPAGPPPPPPPAGAGGT